MVTSVMQRCRRVGVAVIACLALVQGCRDIGNDEGAARINVPIDSLLAPPGFVAERWPSQGRELYDTVTPTLRPAEARRRDWWTHDRSHGISQEILQFTGTDDANDHFRRADPRTYDEDYPFESTNLEGTRLLAQMSSVSIVWALRGRQTRAACGLFGPGTGSTSSGSTMLPAWCSMIRIPTLPSRFRELMSTGSLATCDLSTN